MQTKKLKSVKYYMILFWGVFLGGDIPSRSYKKIEGSISNSGAQNAHQKFQILIILCSSTYATANVAVQVLLHIMHVNIYTATLLVY